MATVLRRRPAVSHDDRLALTDHLDELRSRLIVCVVALVACFAVTFSQNERVLDLINAPLKETQNLKGEKPSQDPLEQSARYQVVSGAAFRAQAQGAQRQAAAFDRLAALADSPAERTAYASAAAAQRTVARTAGAAAAAVPTNRERLPVTLGVAEPFTATISVAFWAALLLALPILLYQAYAFILPAFEPSERKVALPLLLMVPFLFVGGVVFGYLIVLPRAVDFLQNFNDDDFDILIQAKEYFRFAIVFIGSIGILFQIPVGVLAVTRLGVVSPEQLRRQRGPVLLGLAVLAAVATPTPDPYTMLLAMGPLFLLFEGATWLATFLNKRFPPGTLWDFDEDEGDEDDDDLDYPDEPHEDDLAHDRHD
jgi:sec-independent protein translocase protein TatC